ncbi:MAG: response regulator [Thermodesulfobacteriota bacterium]|nr:response regulator [Thermodesulfobacteriota bacterium]
MLTILVIDDEKPTLSMFKLFLSAYGYNVFTAENGEDGIAVFNDKKPEIVFTDLKMPGMDGLEVLQKIKESEIKSQVIVITGHGDMDKAILALDLDAADFINKPVEREALDAALLRAEARMDSSPKNHFQLSHNISDNIFYIELKGSITGDAEKQFSELQNIEEVKTMDKVIVKFDNNFAINRSGISCFMNFLNQTKTRCDDITLDGLSCNFKKIFQMVGISRAANFS